MAIKTVIHDNDNNELDCFINTKGNAVIIIKNLEFPQDLGSLVTLDKEDLDHLIKRLKQLKEDLE